MKTENDPLAEKLRAKVKDVLTAKRKAIGVMSEVSDELVERACNEVMVTFSKKIGDGGTRFSEEEINAFMRESISEICDRY